MAESSEDHQALDRPDEETRDVGWEEFDKEADFEADQQYMGSPMFGFPGPLAWFARRPRLFGRPKSREI